MARSIASPTGFPAGSRIAVCSWSLAPEGPDALVAALGRLRIDAVQLALSPVADDPARWGDAPERLRDAEVRVVSGMMALRGEDYSTLAAIARTGGVRPDATWSENLAHATAVAAIAGAAGLSLVTFHAGFIPEDAAGAAERATMLDRLRTLADVFAAHGVRLALETGQETAATLVALLDALDRPSVGVNFDPANMILYGMGEPVAALRLLAERASVHQVHVKDALPTDVPGTWGREVPAGDGAVDWPAFLAVARTLDPPVDLVIEREAGATREADIARARDLLQDCVRGE